MLIKKILYHFFFFFPKHKNDYIIFNRVLNLNSDSCPSEKYTGCKIDGKQNLPGKPEQWRFTGHREMAGNAQPHPPARGVLAVNEASAF